MTMIRRGPRFIQPRTPPKRRVGTDDVCMIIVILCRIFIIYIIYLQPTSYNCTTAVHDKKIYYYYNSIYHIIYLYTFSIYLQLRAVWRAERVRLLCHFFSSAQNSRSREKYNTCGDTPILRFRQIRYKVLFIMPFFL